MSTDLLAKTPPQNLEAETCVLGSILLDNDAVGIVTEILQPSDFYSRLHRAVYEASLELYDENRAVDIVMVKDKLVASKVLDELGGVEALVEIMESVPSAAHAGDYARIVRDRAVKRRLISIANQVIHDAFEAEGGAEDLLEFVESEVFKLAENRGGNDPTDMKTVLHNTVKLVEFYSKNRGKITGCATSYYDLDEKTNGFQKGDFIILAARPSVGKTTFSINCALNMAVRHGKSVAFFSLEMAKEQIAVNMLCARAEVNSHRLRKGNITETDWSKILAAAGDLHELPIFIDDTPGLSPTALRAKARRLKRQAGIDCIIIDYLQLMDAPKAENRQQQISIISRSLKGLARELEVPIIALSQINRAAEKEDRKPRMSDLRESGAIEQDADVIMFLYDPTYQKGEEVVEEPGAGREIHLIIAKQRNGPTGTVRVQFVREKMLFRNLQQEF